jgi:hypothetical protein
MSTLTVPAAPEAITPDWMTAALRESGVISTSRVTSIETEIVGAGVGFIGQLARVALTYDAREASAPASLIAKFPTLDPGGRQIGNLFRFYEREVRFYEEIGPDCGLCAPQRYFSHADVSGDQYILLLQDMDAAGAHVGNDLQGCTIEEAELVVRNAAAFHARWWQRDELLRLAWMPFINDPVYQSAEHSYQQTWPVFLGMYGDRLSARLRKDGEAMQTRVIALLELLRQPPLTMSHGDYRADNMFFGPAAGDLTLCDWQIASKCRGAFDIAYFLSMSIAPELRAREEMRLLRLWRDGLIEHGVPDYSWEQAQHDYRLGVLFSWLYVVIAIGSLDPANERGLALFNAIFERRRAAFEDLDAGKLLPA